MKTIILKLKETAQGYHILYSFRLYATSRMTTSKAIDLMMGYVLYLRKEE